MGWSTVDVPERSVLFDGIAGERFYFVHSYAAHTWELSTPDGPFAAVEPQVTWATHGERFVAAVENGPLSATQFHPEKSGEAGLALLAQLGPLPLTARATSTNRSILHRVGGVDRVPGSPP